MAGLLVVHLAVGLSSGALLAASPHHRRLALRAQPPLVMQFPSKPPPEVMRVLEPAYEGAARGGTPFVVGTEQELTAIWNAMVRVYGSREDALAAVRRNQQVILPYMNTPECIIGAHAALVTIFGKEGAAEIIRKNPGVLACNPTSLAKTPAKEIENAANFVVWFDGLPSVVKEGIPFFTFLGLVGIIAGRIIVCKSGQCGTTAEWDLQGGLGVQLLRALGVVQ
ncbi:hypothetical protein AB1Y20_000636 [Prymnesium parvum]|uniref:Uncharacterized protein n=1 Tax=Prymnesium parvum TaxID=97485 RepID=A0AB34K940_PRYPA